MESPWYERAQEEPAQVPLRGSRFSPSRTQTLSRPGDFVDALKLHSNVANIGDVRSL